MLEIRPRTATQYGKPLTEGRNMSSGRGKGKKRRGGGGGR